LLKNEGSRLLRVIVCSPQTEYFHINNIKSHNIKQKPNKTKAKEQHNKLKSLIETFGSEVIDVSELDGHPNSVFTRDTAICTPDGYIKLKMGLETRKGEEDWMAQVLNAIGEPSAGNIESPGTVEGGDVILGGSVAFIGHSQRTNNSGIKQITHILERMGFETRVVVVPPPYLHLGGAMSIIGEDSVLCCKDIFPPDFFDGFNKVEINCNNFVGGNVICLGDNELIANSANIETIEILKKARYIVHPIDLSEFIKGAGGPTCLIMPVERG